MQVQIDQAVLLDGVSRALGSVERNGSLPILATCLIQTNGAGIKIAATDLEVYFEGRLEADVVEQGGVAVQANYLHNLLKTMPQTKLSINVNAESYMTIRAGDSQYDLMGLPVDHFPPAPDLPEGNQVEIRGGLLAEMIGKTIFACSHDQFQLHLQGVHVEKVEVDGKPGLRLVATDGHRLAYVDRPIPGSETLELNSCSTIPIKAAREIGRMWERTDQTAISLAASEKALAIISREQTLRARFLEKPFPDYRRVVPSNYQYRFTINRQALITVLKRMAMLSEEKYKGVIFSFTEDKVVARIESPSVGHGKEVLPITTESNPGSPKEDGDESSFSLTIGFNIRYLLDPLLAMGGEYCSFEVDTPKRAWRLTSPEDPHYSNLVMPMDI